eukprot:807677-Rhodomonas_salina.1
MPRRGGYRWYMFLYHEHDAALPHFDLFKVGLTADAASEFRLLMPVMAELKNFLVAYLGYPGMRPYASFRVWHARVLVVLVPVYPGSPRYPGTRIPKYFADHHHDDTLC